MNLTPKLADKLAQQYDRDDLNRALADVIRRQGGLCAALNDDARRDLILTLGDNRRSRNAWNFWRRIGGDTSRPWSAAYRAMLNAAFRKAADPLKQAAE